MDKAIEPKKCPICKKEFIPAPMHVYKYRDKLVCSYTCSREGDKKRKYKPYNIAR